MKHHIHEKGTWYVLRVETGHEDRAERELRKNIGTEALCDICVPRSEYKRKFHGKWKIVQGALFPGYIFVLTNDVFALHVMLPKISGITYIIKNDAGFLPLDEKGLSFLKAFRLFDDDVIGFSEGYIEGDEVFITKGPLQGQTAYIAKINRHKRIAILSVNMMGRDVEVKVGLEILVKRD